MVLVIHWLLEATASRLGLAVSTVVNTVDNIVSNTVSGTGGWLSALRLGRALRGTDTEY